MLEYINNKIAKIESVEYYNELNKITKNYTVSQIIIKSELAILYEIKNKILNNQ